MKTKYIAVLLLLFICSTAIAQDYEKPLYKVKGYVDYNRSSVNPASVYVTVYNDFKLFQTNVDSNGYFYLGNMNYGYYNIIICVNDTDKTYDNFFINYENSEVAFELPQRSYCHLYRCYTKITTRRFPLIDRAPNQQIEALAAYQRGVDYGYSNTFNFGNTNEINIGK